MRKLVALVLVISLLVGMAAKAFAEGPIAVQEAWKRINAGALLIDVRSNEEYESGHLPGAINIPHTEISSHLSLIGDNKNREIVLYCRSGRRSGLALEELTKLGYKNAFNAGGYQTLQESAPK